VEDISSSGPEAFGSFYGGSAPTPYLLEPEVVRPAAAPPVGVQPDVPPARTPEPATARSAARPAAGVDLHDLLGRMLDAGASDLHLTSGASPALRVHGTLSQLDLPMMTPPVLQQVIYSILTQRQRERFEEVWELDMSYSLPGRARFRVNVYRQRDSIGAAFRLIPYEIKPLEGLGVPATVGAFAGLARGFVLVTGPTGSGKSTTLASLVDLANRTRDEHIMTVEDPIEFLHRHNRCIVNQREVGSDTQSFSSALKHALRQDPDIVMVGELRDLETISVALTAAETGHLVFATLHTQDAPQTIDRVIDVFPPHQQQQVRVQLAGALQGVVSQTLVKRSDMPGRIIATEVLTVTPAIRNLIREGKTHQIYSAMQAGAQHGMQTLDQSLAALVRAQKVSYETALEKAHHTEDFNRLIGRA
jgi:twitching motility protein PilT